MNIQEYKPYQLDEKVINGRTLSLCFKGERLDVCWKRADQSHRIPSYQPDRLIEKHLHKKQCRKRYKAPSSIRIHILLSVYLLHYTCTIKLVM